MGSSNSRYTINMSDKDNFERAWRTRFPGDPLPDLTCFHPGNDREGLTSALRQVELRRDSLQKELEHCNFIITFLSSLTDQSDNKNNTLKHGDTALLSKPESKSDSVGKGKAKGKVEHVVPQSSPVTSKPVSSFVHTFTENTPVPSFTSTATKPLKADVNDDINTTTATVDSIHMTHSSCLTEQTDVIKYDSNGPTLTPERTSNVSLSGSGGICDGDQLTHSLPRPGQKSRPTVSETIQIVNRQDSLRKVNSPTDKPKLGTFATSLPKKGPPVAQKTGNRPPLLKTLSQPETQMVDKKDKPTPAPRPSKHGPVFVPNRHSAHPSLPCLSGGDTAPCAGIREETVPLSNLEIQIPKDKKNKQNRKMEGKDGLSSDDGITDSGSCSSIPSVVTQSNPLDCIVQPPDRDSRKMDDDVIYDEPIPVNRRQVESSDSSSDEEEQDPIYYNILLLKHQSMKISSLDMSESIYASVDKQRKMGGTLVKHFSMIEESPSSPPSFKPVNRKGFIKLDIDSKAESSSDADYVFSDRPPPALPKENPSQSSGDSAAAWKKRQSMLIATENQSTDSDEVDLGLPGDSDASQEEMRKWVVTSVLNSEQNYVGVLDVLLQYQKTFKAVVGTQTQVISKEDIEAIFSKIPDLHKIHYQFIYELEPRIAAWNDKQCIADIYKVMALEEYQIAPLYLNNYQHAVSTLQRLWQENPRFYELTATIPCRGNTQKLSLEELLHKPVVRFQRNTLVLHDLIRCTPTSHTDYDQLQKTLKIAHNFLENFQSPKDSNMSENQRYLAKQCLTVEKVGNSRKVRHAFLFNDVLVCCKQKISGRQKVHYDVKWFIPLADMLMIDRSSPAEERQMEESQQREVDLLTRRVSELQIELKTELKKARQAENGHRNWSVRGHNRNAEKLKKKLAEQEAALILALPHLVFKLRNKKNEKQAFFFLMSSDYERSNWKEAIKGLQNRKSYQETSYSSVNLENFINSLDLPKVSSLGTELDKEEIMLGEEYLFGCLNVTIHGLQGLKKPCDTFCCLEVDTMGHFFLKAKTNVITNCAEPSWLEDFEIDLDGTQTLRILCYLVKDSEPELVGKCALELNKTWLRGDFQESSVALNEELSLTVTLQYSSRDQTLKRTPSAAKGGLFGVRLGEVCKREHVRIPILVKSCVEQVEKRGLHELGIYRISGLSSEIQKMKHAFEKSSKGAAVHLEDSDINVVTSLMKMYLRQLPEALFTDKLYPKLMQGMALQEPEAKEKCMLSLMKSLPRTNLEVIDFILDHLVRVSQRAEHNKMSLDNLATVFGPTLLRPANKDQQPITMDMFSAGARDAMMQTSTLLFYLNIKARGGSIVPSSMVTV